MLTWWIAWVRIGPLCRRAAETALYFQRVPLFFYHFLTCLPTSRRNIPLPPRAFPVTPHACKPREHENRPHHHRLSGRVGIARLGASRRCEIGRFAYSG